ncbi:MAG: ribosome biogenesis GTP-binding protein YihA/YsxC [Myxococcales bacterium]|nr:ribosome biogenesis GTP-binding protein YihA/YsxC [Myxococcales bacterium]
MSGARRRAARVTGAERVASAANAQQFPAPSLPEVAFLGRSNVGKSSLLNRLVGRRRLAFTSATPGKTRLVHWYRAARSGRDALLVDLPGYGYAKVSRAERAQWKGLIESYLADRPTLRVAVLLQDLRRDVSEQESLLVDWLRERGVPVLIALTKTDKLKPMRRAARVRALRAAIGLPAERVLVTSAQTGSGIDDLWRAIDAFL